MENKYGILALDLGTSGAKAALVTLDGNCRAWAMEKLPLIIRGTTGAEQDPNAWWKAVDRAATRVIAQDTIPREHILAVSTSSMGEETVAVDKAGNPLMNALNWMDQRGAQTIKAQLKGWLNAPGLGYGLSNLMQWIWYTGGIPSPSGKDPAGHITHIRDHHPKIYEATHKFLNSLDFINLKLTGEFVATHDSILPLWVTNNRNLKRIRYEPRLITALGLDRERLPDLVPSTTVLGPLKSKLSQAWGLASHVKVVAGAVDTSAATLGSGAVGDFIPCLTLGTSSFITAHLPFKKTHIRTNMASFPCAHPGKYLLMNNQTMAGGCLSHLAHKMVYHRDELLREKESPDMYKIFDTIAARVPPGSNGLVYTPWLFGERSPADDQTLRGSLHNLSLHNTREDVVRSVFEGVALNSRWLMEGVKKFLKQPCADLRMAGGGACSDIWCQIYADVLDCRIHQIQNPIESNARGAAFIGAVGLGELEFEALPQRVPIQRVYTPNPRHRNLYDHRYARFREFYKNTRSIFGRLNAPTGKGNSHAGPHVPTP